MRRQRPNGFTLIELSLVLLVIGLLVGGIIAGQSMIRASQLRGVVGEMQQYTQAVGAFRDKYQALPGDFFAADSLWANVHNGDGDGRITLQNSSAPSYAVSQVESFYAWQQLAAASLVEGKYSGAAGTAGNQDRVPGTNIPGSQLPTVGWALVTFTADDYIRGNHDLTYVAGDIPPNTVLWLGGRSTTGTSNLMRGAISPGEASEMDLKIDDGLPTTGKMISQAGGTSCYSASQYDFTVTSNACAIVFKTGY